MSVLSKLFSASQATPSTHVVAGKTSLVMYVSADPAEKPHCEEEFPDFRPRAGQKISYRVDRRTDTRFFPAKVIRREGDGYLLRQPWSRGVSFFRKREKVYPWPYPLRA